MNNFRKNKIKNIKIIKIKHNVILAFHWLIILVQLHYKTKSLEFQINNNTCIFHQ